MINQQTGRTSSSFSWDSSCCSIKFRLKSIYRMRNGRVSSSGSVVLKFLWI